MNPATEEILTAVQSATPQDVDREIAAITERIRKHKEAVNMVEALRKRLATPHGVTRSVSPPTVKEESMKKYEGKFKHVRIAYDPNKTVAELLREMLKRTNTRVLDFFRLIDEDNSGIIAKKEWCKAFIEIGPDFPPAIVALTFDEFDPDKSGEIEYKEMNAMLRKGAGSEITNANLKRMAGKQKDTSRLAKLTAKNVNENYVTQRAAVLPRFRRFRRFS